MLSSPDAMRQLAESQAAIAAGDVLNADQLATAMAQHPRPPADR